MAAAKAHKATATKQYILVIKIPSAAGGKIRQIK
jgi:hypothetical protein